MTDLQAVVQVAREKRLREKGVDNPADTANATELLMGECQRNAAAVRDELQSRGIPCQVVGGALRNMYREDELPTSFAETKLDGIGVHYWVESNGTICEVASESGPHWGDAIALDVAPEKLGYKRFDDSYDVSVPF